MNFKCARKRRRLQRCKSLISRLTELINMAPRRQAKTYEVMRRHIESRHGHFAGEAILAGQFADLEEPKNALALDVSCSPQALATGIITNLHLAELPPLN